MTSIPYPLFDERKQFNDSTLRLSIDLVKLEVIISHDLSGEEELSSFQEHLQAHRALLEKIEQMLSEVSSETAHMPQMQ